MPEVLTGLTFSQVNPNIYEQYRQTRDAEMFEQLVFDYMLNKHSDDQDLKDYIMSLPRHQKRTAIVSVIDGNNNLWNQLHDFIENCPDKMTLVKNVIHIINKFVKDGEVERKKYGEVMTPISLVKEMLDTLPKEVWSNPNLKWLDPANGAGTFPFVVIYKLMNGLSKWEPDMEKRYKHIVENMIYTCELQSRNVILWLLGVDPKDEYTTNTYWGSFLDEGFDNHMKEVWGVEKFDIIIGNPPYNDTKNVSTKTRSLYPIFVEKSKKLCDYITLMIIPSRWFLTDTFSDFRKKMIYDFGLYRLKHFTNHLLFDGADIKGGLCYFQLLNNFNGQVMFKIDDGNYESKNFTELGKIYIGSEVETILNKIINKKILDISSMYKRNGHINSTDQRLKSNFNENSIVCHGSKSRIFYIEDVDESSTFLHKFKVATPVANGVGNNYITNFIIVPPGECLTASYCLFPFDTLLECENFIHNLGLMVNKFLVKISKSTQNVTSSCFDKVIIDTSRKWTNDELFEYLDLSQSEKNIIQNLI